MSAPNEVIKIDMGALAKRTGKSELELAKMALNILAIKASVTGTTQHVKMSFPKE